LEITLKDFEWINVAKNLSYVKDIEVTGNKVKVEVRNLEKNKTLLLKHALDYNVDIIKFQMYNDTLEDMFLKMVVEK
jgi:ABC-2 type transport system ATP-binding protein